MLNSIKIQCRLVAYRSVLWIMDRLGVPDASEKPTKGSTKQKKHSEVASRKHTAPHPTPKINTVSPQQDTNRKKSRAPQTRTRMSTEPVQDPVYLRIENEDKFAGQNAVGGFKNH